MKFLLAAFVILFFLSCSKGEKNDFDNKIIYANDYETDPISGDTVYMISIPSGFSPNSDGVNDMYCAKGFGMNNFTMKVFAGNGNMIFYSNDIFPGWDGRLQGRSNVLAMGMYDVDISTTDPLGTSHNYLHRITLFK